ncbi:MAG: hypothetical protein AB1697_02700 [Pseudomonadota bacterium]
MAWFEKEMDYARESLTQVSEAAIERAGEKLGEVMRDGVKHAGEELKEVVQGVSQEIDAKLDKISLELHNQRQFTKDDVKELVDYAADKLSNVLDDRIQLMKREISDLVQDKTEYFKREVDNFFIQRQQDLARERRRLALNIALAFAASVAVGAVSLFYKRLDQAPLDMLTVFRIVLGSLAGGYAVYLIASLLRRWLAMAEHKKDMVFLAARYWGWLRPSSVFATVLTLIILAILGLILVFPLETLRLIGRPEWVPMVMPGR